MDMQQVINYEAEYNRVKRANFNSSVAIQGVITVMEDRVVRASLANLIDMSVATDIVGGLNLIRKRLALITPNSFDVLDNKGPGGIH